MRPCETCTGACCKVYFVNLNGHDVWSIASELRMTPQQFVIIAQETESSPIGFHLDAAKTTFAMVLDKRPGPDGLQQCVFLMNLGGDIGRCGIYPHRPAACRVFPGELRRGAVSFREAVTCPKGSWNVAGIDLPVWREALLRSHMEWSIYASVVSCWNERASKTPAGETRTPQEYYDYLIGRYERLAALDRSLPGARLNEIVRSWGQEGADTQERPWRRYLADATATIRAD